MVDVKLIKKIEKSVYPRYMRQMQDCDTIEDLADYAECSVDELLIEAGQDWYLIAAVHNDWIEVVDIATTNRAPIFHVIALLKNKFYGKTIVMDCRESTSLRIMQLLIERYHIDYHDETWKWNKETMHTITFKMEDK